jgi:hypothetical protein
MGRDNKQDKNPRDKKKKIVINTGESSAKEQSDDFALLFNQKSLLQSKGEVRSASQRAPQYRKERNHSNGYPKQGPGESMLVLRFDAHISQ